MARYATTKTSLNSAVDTVADKAEYLQNLGYSEVTADDPVLQAAAMVNGIVNISDQTTAQDVTTASATALIALIPDCQVGHTFEFAIQNENTSNGAATLVGGADVTVSVVGTAAQPIDTTRLFRARVTNVGTPALTIYAVGELA
jgi:hypothetical protein